MFSRDTTGSVVHNTCPKSQCFFVDTINLASGCCDFVTIMLTTFLVHLKAGSRPLRWWGGFLLLLRFMGCSGKITTFFLSQQRQRISRLDFSAVAALLILVIPFSSGGMTEDKRSLPPMNEPYKVFLSKSLVGTPICCCKAVNRHLWLKLILQTRPRAYSVYKPHLNNPSI